MTTNSNWFGIAAAIEMTRYIINARDVHHHRHRHHQHHNPLGINDIKRGAQNATERYVNAELRIRREEKRKEEKRNFKETDNN